MEFLFLTLWFFYPYMDLLKVCSTKLIFTLLSALAAASTRDTNIRKCMERLQTNLQAYEKHQKACKDLLHYTVIRPERDGSATKDLFSLQQSLTDAITPDKMMTMITLRQCDRAVVESTSKVNLISVMQQYLTNENDRTFSAGNLKMTIDLVEAEFLLGYKMISSLQEDMLMTCNNLNVLIIKNLDKIFFDVYKNWIIDRIEEFVTAMQDTTEKNDGDIKSKIDELYGKYSKEFFEVMEMKLLRYDSSVFNPAMRRYGAEFDYIYADVAKFEERREFKYFTANPSEFCRIFDHLTWKVYLHCLVEKISEIALEGFEAVKDVANEQKLKDAFLYDYTAKSTNSVKDNIEKEAVSEMYSNGELCDVGDLNGKTKRQHNYFDSIGFKMLQDKLKSAECPIIDKLLQQFETQATTKICVNEKISIDNFYDYLGVFGEENVCEELKTSKALFVDKGKVFEEENSILDDSWDLINPNEYDDVSMKANSAREFKFTSKVICTDQKWNFTDQFEQQESVEISVTQENVNLDILPCIEILRSKSPAIMENKMSDMYKVSVKSSNFNVNIYLMNNIANDGMTNKKSIIYDITETDGINDNQITSKKSIVYLEDVPIIFVQKLLHYLQRIQMTRPIKFEFSNIMLLNDKDIAYIETNYKNSRTDYDLPQLPENFITKNMIRCRDNFRLGPKFESLLVDNRHITEFVKHTEKYSEAFGIKPADFECIIRKSFTDALFAEDELDDPFVITDPSIKYDLDCMPPISLNNDEPILHAFLAKKCKPMNLLSISPLQIIKRLMNSKKRTAVLTALTSIAKAMSTDVDTVPLMIEQLLKIQDDGNTAPNNSMPSQNQLRIIFLQKIGCLFGYTDVWKTENTNEDEKTKKLTNICTEQKKLLTASIEVLVQVLIGSSSELKHHNTFKTVSIIKCEKNIVSEDKQPCGAKHSQYTLLYGNFESLKTIYEHCTAENGSKEDEME